MVESHTYLTSRSLLLEKSAFVDFARHLLSNPDEMAALRDRLERSPRVALYGLLKLTADQKRNLLAASDAGLALAVAPFINALGVTLAINISNGFVRGSEGQQSGSSARQSGWIIVHTGGSGLHYIDPWLAMELIVLLAERGINPTNDALDAAYHAMTGLPK
jgi:hypothetical protein